jgi:hypothetical protein
MNNELEQALRHALEAEQAAPRTAGRRIDLAEDPEVAAAAHGDTLVAIRSPLPPVSGWQPPRRSVGEALTALPGGVVLKPLWILLREVLLIGLFFWLLLVGLAMWQTSPPGDVLLEQDTAVITALVAALSIRLAWAVVRRAVLDALID